MPLVVTDKESGKHYSRSSGSNSSGFHKTVRRSRTLNEEKTLPAAERSKPPAPRHASQSLDDLVRCAICLEQLNRPTMVPVLVFKSTDSLSDRQKWLFHILFFKKCEQVVTVSTHFLLGLPEDLRPKEIESHRMSYLSARCDSSVGGHQCIANQHPSAGISRINRNNRR